jgi:hypothetical protein
MRVYRLTGFLLGSVLSGASMYYYVLNEYRVSNELLTEDIFVRTSTMLDAMAMTNLRAGFTSDGTEDRGILEGVGGQD